MAFPHTAQMTGFVFLNMGEPSFVVAILRLPVYDVHAARRSTLP
jgi:hypothetical protein